jgi:purine-binding chemotaxis protein CheW
MSVSPENVLEYVTMTVGGQLFGLPISRVQDVFATDRLTWVPLAPPEVAGLLNLRGRIVTAIDMRRKLGLDASGSDAPRMAVGVEYRGESYGLLIDTIGEVMRLAASSHEDCPINLDREIVAVTTGVHRLDSEVLLILDVDRILDVATQAKAA